ncbi:PREDICTED: basic proline-rich protein-like [Nipponia nippon]|uniref:basic proline-rich protein-like n=1 Tax=Nipponia nippon TaxID=128390 RepID=UPI000510E7E8|nr:PREDICTED: basic proline-rich protein-like [Nipponia nippon]
MNAVVIPELRTTSRYLTKEDAGGGSGRERAQPSRDLPSPGRPLPRGSAPPGPAPSTGTEPPPAPSEAAEPRGSRSPGISWHCVPPGPVPLSGPAAGAGLAPARTRTNLCRAAGSCLDPLGPAAAGGDGLALFRLPEPN